MILLPIILTPVALTVLLLVMSWTERGLDREPRKQRTPPTRVHSVTAVAAVAPVELAGLTEPLIAP